jgi:hypothetical protein
MLTDGEGYQNRGGVHVAQNRYGYRRWWPGWSSHQLLPDSGGSGTEEWADGREFGNTERSRARRDLGRNCALKSGPPSNPRIAPRCSVSEMTTNLPSTGSFGATSTEKASCEVCEIIIFVHSSLTVTTAMEAGLTDQVWSICRTAQRGVISSKTWGRWCNGTRRAIGRALFLVMQMQVRVLARSTNIQRHVI